MSHVFDGPLLYGESSRFDASTLYEKISRGLFPRPVKLEACGRAVGWPEREIAAYQKARIEARSDLAPTRVPDKGGHK